MKLEEAQVLVIGAGPAGLATMACLRQEGLRARLVDHHGEVGGAYRRLYGNIVMASPARWTSLPGLDIEAFSEYITVGQYGRYLQDYAAYHAITAERATVESLVRHDRDFQVTFAGDPQPHRFQAVVAATGLDTPVIPDIPGLADVAHLHSRQWQGPEPFRGKRLLIIGRATSAVEIAEEAVRAGLTPVVSAHGKVALGPKRILGLDVHDFVFRFSWLPTWLAGWYCHKSPTFSTTDDGFNHFLRSGLLTLRPPVTRFEEDLAIFEDGACQKIDVVVCATGYRQLMPFLPTEVARSSGDGHPLAEGGESLTWPGFYLMGIHCSGGVSSQFLRGMALDAPRVARRLRERVERL